MKPVAQSMLTVLNITALFVLLSSQRHCGASDPVPTLGSLALQVATFSADGEYLLTASDKAVHLWEVRTGRQRQHFEGHRERVHMAILSADREWALTGAGTEHDMGSIPKDATARLWNVGTGVAWKYLVHGTLVFSGQFSPNGKQLLTVCKGAYAHVWDPQSGNHIFEFSVDESLYHEDRYVQVFAPASFSPDGSKLMAKTRQVDKVATIWDTTTWKEIARIPGDSRGLRTAIFSPNGESILTASRDHTAKTWNADTGEMRQEFRGHESTVSSAVYLPNGERVVTASLDRTVRLWDARTGAELKRFIHRGEVKYALISVDGTRILTKWEAVGLNSERNYHVALWDAESGAEIKQLPLRENCHIAILNPKGDRALVTGERTTLLDTKTGNIIHEYD